MESYGLFCGWEAQLGRMWYENVSAFDNSCWE